MHNADVYKYLCAWTAYENDQDMVVIIFSAEVDAAQRLIKTYTFSSSSTV